MVTLKIIVVGPPKSGKSRLVNLLADRESVSSDKYQPTAGVRVLELEMSGSGSGGLRIVPAAGTKSALSNSTVYVQLWDVGGDSSYDSCWPAIQWRCDGVIFVHTSSDSSLSASDQQYLQQWRSALLNSDQQQTQTSETLSDVCLSVQQCLLVHTVNDSREAVASSSVSQGPFSVMRQLSVNFQQNDDKLFTKFSEFVSSVLKSSANAQIH